MKVQTLLYDATFWIYLPIPVTIFIYSLLRMFTKHRWKIIHATTEYSVVFYIVAVLLIINTLFDLFLLNYVLIVFILLLATLMIKQWKKDEPISVSKALKLLLRIVFLLFFLLYITMIVIYFLHMYL